MTKLRALAIACLMQLSARSVNAQNADPITDAKRLRDAHQYGAAAAALQPYLAQNPRDAGTHWFRAQLLTWAGDREGARREYEKTLSLTAPNTPSADSLTRYIADLSSTWIAANAGAHSDDQPFRSSSGAFEAGRYVGGGAAVFVDASLAGYDAPDETPSSSTTVTNGYVGFRTSGAHAFGATLGIDRSSLAARTLLTGSAWVSLFNIHSIGIAASFARSGYHYTIESMDTAVAVNAFEVAAEHVTARGIAGRAAVRTERFSDNNSTNVAYGWVLLPLAGGLRAGYALDLRDAAESRWNGVRFDPYYTPEKVQVHSVIGEWAWRDFKRAVQVNGGVGFHARELAPYLLNPSGKQHGFTTRSYTPWNVSASATWRATWRTSLHAEIHHDKTAFYQATSGQLGTTLLLR